jgi:hypothetical protein
VHESKAVLLLYTAHRRSDWVRLVLLLKTMELRSSSEMKHRMKIPTGHPRFPSKTQQTPRTLFAMPVRSCICPRRGYPSYTPTSPIPCSSGRSRHRVPGPINFTKSILGRYAEDETPWVLFCPAPTTLKYGYMRTSSNAAPGKGRPVLAGRARLDMHLRLDDHDPLVPKKLCGRCTLLWIAHEALFQEVHTLWAQLVRRRQLGRIALCDVVHNGPFVVEARPGASARRHLKNHAAEGPDVDRASLAWIVASDDLRGHVHRRASHGLIGLHLNLRLCETLPLAGDDLRSPKVHILDNPIVVEKYVYIVVSNISGA